MSVSKRLQWLESIDISALSAGASTAALRDIAVIRGKTDQLEAALARRISELHAAGDSAPAADALGRCGTASRRATERAERRADALGETPQLDDALGKGRVGAEHADALASAASRLDDAQRAELFARDREITELAASATPDVFRRRLTRIVDDITDDDGLDRASKQRHDATLSMKIDDDTGMHTLFARLTPEDGNRLRRALDHEAAALANGNGEHSEECRGLRRDQLLVQALVRIVAGEAIGTGMGPAEVAVLIDYETLVAGLHEHSVSEYSDGSPIPAETARRHACEAKIIPVVLGEAGEVLDVGRAQRLATPAQRTALRSIYRTCAIDGCDAHFDRCHVHHIHEWEHHGPTDLDNLLPLCSFHHHRVHEGRWQLRLEFPDRRLTVTLPGGRWHSTSLPDRLPRTSAA
ncbi:MAG: DUF222 domain-containing protein [Ilumatobacter sp.]|uniref:HNH endonuclease signature motif containing protein n=1 Tax=Ilumatobacter sp. TaxID=1967498 RepID=UPI00391C3E45